MNEITELMLEQTWHVDFVDPRLRDLYFTGGVAQLVKD